MKYLILGGARSGKSRYAENAALALHQQSNSDSSLIYLATATSGDSEMQDRIKHHQQRRDSEKWLLKEEPVNIANVISECKSSDTILVDCLTLWLSNCLHQQCWLKQRDTLLGALNHYQGNVVMVSNEVGSGIVPMGALSRQFVDESGWLHQQLAEICDNVSLVVAGLPLHIKGELSKQARKDL